MGQVRIQNRRTTCSRILIFRLRHLAGEYQGHLQSKGDQPPDYSGCYVHLLHSLGMRREIEFRGGWEDQARWKVAPEEV
jgi:hypothetical protein